MHYGFNSWALGGPKHIHSDISIPSKRICVTSHILEHTNPRCILILFGPNAIGQKRFAGDKAYLHLNSTSGSIGGLPQNETSIVLDQE